MKIPKKITPDHLRDCIVQIVFDPMVPADLVVGMAYNCLSGSFRFVSPPQQSHQILGISVAQSSVGHLIHNEGQVKLGIGLDAIVFNINEQYPGWDIFFRIIKDSIEKLKSNNIIGPVSRIGIRFISQFEKVDLEKNFFYNLSIPSSENKKTITHSKIEYIEKNFKCIVNLMNNTPAQKGDDVTEISVVDIDVIQEFESTVDLNEIFELIINGHKQQLEIFFNTITPNYLKTLNPEYE
jgi:uncharacterized protein (TIGR04255 family)